MALPLPANQWTIEQIESNGRDHAAYGWSARPQWAFWSKEQVKAYFEAYYTLSDELRIEQGLKPFERNIDAIIEDGGKRIYWNGISE